MIQKPARYFWIIKMSLRISHLNFNKYLRHDNSVLITNSGLVMIKNKQMQENKREYQLPQPQNKKPVNSFPGNWTASDLCHIDSPLLGEQMSFANTNCTLDRHLLSTFQKEAPLRWKFNIAKIIVQNRDICRVKRFACALPTFWYLLWFLQRLCLLVQTWPDSRSLGIPHWQLQLQNLF